MAMPNPFPGMNPYLEDRRLWRDVHWRFVAYAAELLQPQLRPRYHVRIEERLYVQPVERPIYPDISVMERRKVQPLVEPSPSGGAAVAIATAVEVTYDEPTAIAEVEGPITEGYLEIVDLARGGKVVTIIELLSHANKTIESDAHRQYVQKQREALAAGIGLVEIDLLREGAYVMAAPFHLVKLMVGKPWHYLVSIRPASMPHRFYLYAVTLRQPLPRIFVPLAPDDPKVGVLDLQAVLNRCYEAGAYDDVIDYRQDPHPPEFSPDDKAWLEATLKEKGLRP